MIVRKVAFEKTIGMPNYSNDRPIVLEADLEPGETKEQAWTRMNQDMIAWHKAEYPHLYQPENVTSGYYSTDLPNPPITTYPAPGIINIQDEKTDCNDILVLIRTAPTLEELKTYKTLASADQSKERTLYSAYNQRLKTLSIDGDK